MSRRISLVLAILCLPALCLAPALEAQAPAATPPATAAAPAAPPPPAVIGNAKVAWMDLQQALYTCEEGKQKLGEVQKFVESKNAELESKTKELETLRDQLKVQGPKLTPEALEDLQEQVQIKEVELQRFSQDTQRSIDTRRARAANYIGRKMVAVVEKLAKGKGLSAVIYINPQRDAWVDPSLIITNEVIAAYNLANPVLGGSTAAARNP